MNGGRPVRPQDEEGNYSGREMCEIDEEGEDSSDIRPMGRTRTGTAKTTKTQNKKASYRK